MTGFKVRIFKDLFVIFFFDNNHVFRIVYLKGQDHVGLVFVIHGISRLVLYQYLFFNNVCSLYVWVEQNCQEKSCVRYVGGKNILE